MVATDQERAEDEALAWRNQISLRLLRGVFWALSGGSVVVALAVSRGRGSSLLILFGLVASAVVGVAAFTGRPRGGARGWIIVIPPLLVSIGGFARVGVLAGPGATLMVSLMLAGLLLGRRTMFWLTFCSALSVAGIGWGVVHGLLPGPARADVAMTLAGTWIRSGALTFISVVLFGLLLLAVIDRIEHALRLARSETERRQVAERARAEAEIVALEAKKLELIGRLAAGVAHDFNNNLTAIMGSAELLRHSLASDAESLELTDGILQASRRAAELTQQLLAYSRRAQMLLAPIDLHGVLGDVVALVRRSCDPNVELVTAWGATDPIVAADRTLLESALLNLLINARDAMPAGGTITITTRSVTLDVTSEPHGPCLTLEIRDTGQGIPPDLLPQIFDPFFTTKPVGRGTGLGLAAVAGTIKAHGGRVEVSSEVGRGTTFSIVLPCAAGETSEKAPDSDEIIAGTAHILLVEDDRMVAMTAIAGLQKLGYRVTHAADGKTAVELVRSSSERYDLVVLDLRMPGMSGAAVFDELRALDETLKILLWSGYGAEQDVESMLKRGAVGFVAKPYRVAELSRTIARVLGNATAPQ